MLNAEFSAPMRVTHYHAAGRGSTSFDCYIDANHAYFKARRSVRRELPPLPDGRPAGFTHDVVTDPGAPPAPRRSTDIAKVTCASCCREIVKMMREKLQ